MCPLGFGFVGFETEEIVEQVCQTRFHQLNGKTVCTSHFVAFFPLLSVLLGESGGVGSKRPLITKKIIFNCYYLFVLSRLR